MTYLLAALFLFSLFNIKNSIIFVFSAGLFLFLLVRQKLSKRFLIFISIIIINFIINKIQLSPVNSFTGIVVEAKENYYLINSLYGKYYIYEKNNGKEEGDILKLEGNRVFLESNAVEQQFDFIEFLNNKGYFYQFYVKEEKIILNSILNKKSFLKKLESKLSNDSLALLKGLYFGINDDESFWFTLSETIHFYPLIGGSGYYFSKFKSNLKSNGKKPKKWVFWFLISPFILLRPTRFLFLRLLVYEVINLVLEKKNIKLSMMAKVGISALIIMFINPFYAYQVNFILSYAILLIYALITPFLKGKKTIIKKVVPFALLQFLLLIYEWYSTYEINLFTPIISLLLPIFYVFYIVLGVMMFLSFYNGIETVSIIYKSFLSMFQNFKININLGEITLFSVFLIMAFVVIIIIEFGKNNQKFLKSNLVIVLFAVLISAMPYNVFNDSITFINVGQGDAVLLRSQGKVMLIDTGGSNRFDVANECLIPYFKKEQIDKIDYFLATHNDFDHVGGMTTLINTNYIKVIMNQSMFPFAFGNVYIENLNIWQNEMTEENNRSYVLSLIVNKIKILLMGDAEIEIEKKMISKYRDLNHDLIKIGHHGSSSSSSLAFLKKVNPKVAIISVGKNNAYHHPSIEVIRRLESLNIKIRRTDFEGTIKY